jgi:hypothetical protein
MIWMTDRRRNHSYCTLLLLLFFILSSCIITIVNSSAIEQYLDEKEEHVREFCDIIVENYNAYSREKKFVYSFNACPMYLSCTNTKITELKVNFKNSVCGDNYGGDSTCGCSSGQSIYTETTSAIQFNKTENIKYFESLYQKDNVTLSHNHPKANTLKFLCASTKLNPVFIRNAKK